MPSALLTGRLALARSCGHGLFQRVGLEQSVSCRRAAPRGRIETRLCSRACIPAPPAGQLRLLDAEARKVLFSQVCGAVQLVQLRERFKQEISSKSTARCSRRLRTCHSTPSHSFTCTGREARGGDAPLRAGGRAGRSQHTRSCAIVARLSLPCGSRSKRS